mmetsp:Transcript_11343/g.39535  ORF Transcript_11343/g.39535 Transcript_11343/m.39535 type:complete len:246 (-) Transcript_11343:385-1122(-)
MSASPAPAPEPAAPPPAPPAAAAVPVSANRLALMTCIACPRRCSTAKSLASSVGLDKTPLLSSPAALRRSRRAAPSLSLKLMMRSAMPVRFSRSSIGVEANTVVHRNERDKMDSMEDDSDDMKYSTLRQWYRSAHAPQRSSHADLSRILPSGVLPAGAVYSGGYARKAPISGRDLAMDRSGSTTMASHGLPARSSMFCHNSCVDTSVADRNQFGCSDTSNGWLWYHPQKRSLRVFSRNLSFSLIM